LNQIRDFHCFCHRCYLMKGGSSEGKGASPNEGISSTVISLFSSFFSQHFSLQKILPVLGFLTLSAPQSAQRISVAFDGFLSAVFGDLPLLALPLKFEWSMSSTS